MAAKGTEPEKPVEIEDADAWNAVVSKGNKDLNVIDVYAEWCGAFIDRPAYHVMNLMFQGSWAYFVLLFSACSSNWSTPVSGLGFWSGRGEAGRTSGGAAPPPPRAG